MRWRDVSDSEFMRIQQVHGILNHFDPSTSWPNLVRAYKISLSYLIYGNLPGGLLCRIVTFLSSVG